MNEVIVYTWLIQFQLRAVCSDMRWVLATRAPGPCPCSCWTHALGLDAFYYQQAINVFSEILFRTYENVD